MLPNSDEALGEVLQRGAIDIPNHFLGGQEQDGVTTVSLADHLLGSLHLYQQHRAVGALEAHHVRDDSEIKFVTQKESLAIQGA